MVRFEEIGLEEFLRDYWQKKPLIIRKALPGFVNELSPDELAGLSMEEEIESRIVLQTPEQRPGWHLKRGPFLERDFANLPETHWTLLVQGLDRFVPEINELLEHFNFIPQWRIDDVMVSFAVKEGSVGPHYDNYDVFLYQAIGRRQWSLTTQHCNETNYLKDVELRIMKQFETEETYILEEGDMLYLPPHVGHYGIAFSDECMTYSFGYRSYQGQEIFDSFAEYISEKKTNLLYKDPNWFTSANSSEIPPQASFQARKLMLEILDNEEQFKDWFACFVTQLDQQAESLLPMPEEESLIAKTSFLAELKRGCAMKRNALCRFAYQMTAKDQGISFFANGCAWDVSKVSVDLVKLVANNRSLSKKALSPYILNSENQAFLFELWSLEWLSFNE
ncbi:MAG: cupin domain-containing protein [Tatlockia sp.]|nr:cupin domain-containing protein [Tatlockia sp.]